ncbi:MAG: type II toxin-antitoxin system RelE/ParE family toxin [Sulfurimonas sp.]|uniref:type II toxin-antitoxin system RelE/ParE family toxin n=1 Tax=Sulfurimonas sp. TaxID=2022749 RepID=UPI00262B2FAF|nr:type II toxin-antitoxin system RelE/ParE family toxin [Sulfurimonas sp.]MDD5373689.1 type II toxin-antitoxin system RelE/ParE family toxin [Sulfurimonas sp.]
MSIQKKYLIIYKKHINLPYFTSHNSNNTPNCPLYPLVFKLIFEHFMNHFYFTFFKQLSTAYFNSAVDIYFNDEEIRDMIFKGYSVVYEVDTENGLIIILNIFHKNQLL